MTAPKPIALTKWSARRVSAAITIEGVDMGTGRPVKVTNVAAIESGDPFPTAKGKVRGVAFLQTISLRP